MSELCACAVSSRAFVYASIWEARFIPPPARRHLVCSWPTLHAYCSTWRKKDRESPTWRWAGLPSFCSLRAPGVSGGNDALRPGTGVRGRRAPAACVPGPCRTGRGGEGRGRAAPHHVLTEAESAPGAPTRPRASPQHAAGSPRGTPTRAPIGGQPEAPVLGFPAVSGDRAPCQWRCCPPPRGPVLVA